MFTLEEGCSLGGAQGAIRHLTIGSNWKRERDKDVMQRMLDLSHLRSLTVFGEWGDFFRIQEDDEIPPSAGSGAHNRPQRTSPA